MLPKVGGDPCPVRRGITAGVKCYVRKAVLFLCWTREARVGCGFQNHKGENLLVVLFSDRINSGLRTSAGEQVGLTSWSSLHGGSNSSVLSFFLLVCVFCFTSVFVWNNVASQPSTSRTWYTRYYTVVRRFVYLACIYRYRVLLPRLLLLCTGFVAAAALAVHRRLRMAKLVDVLNLIISSVCFLSLRPRTTYFSCT